MKTINCAQDDVIFREFETGSCMYRLLSGGVAVYSDYGGSEERKLTALHPGDYFGEMAVIDVCPRSATVVATEPGTAVLEIEAEDLREYLASSPEDLVGIAAHLSRRLRELTADYTEVCDTLRELGRLDTTEDKINDNLLAKIKKFAAVYFKGKKAADRSVEDKTTAESHGDGLAERRKSVERGEVIFREGEDSDCMYDIRAGRVGIYANYGTERQKLLSELVPNMFFGEMGLFGGVERSATAVALEDGTCLELIYESDLTKLYAENTAKTLMILRHLSSRLRRLTNDYLRCCKTLAETEKALDTGDRMTPEMLLQVEYMNQLMLMPEILY